MLLFKIRKKVSVATFYESLYTTDGAALPGSRLSGLFLFVFFTLALAVPVAAVAGVSPALAVASAGLGRRQGLHAQHLVDLTECQQPQRVLEMRNGATVIQGVAVCPQRNKTNTFPVLRLKLELYCSTQIAAVATMWVSTPLLAFRIMRR